MENTTLIDHAKRFSQNPLVSPEQLRPTRPGMNVECLLNPGVFRFDGKVWMLVRVAERPQVDNGFMHIPMYNDAGEIELLKIRNDHPALDASDPRVINFEGKDYLTTLSHLRLLSSDNGVEFHEPDGYAPLFGASPLEAYGIEDCRVTEIDKVYHLTYTMVSSYGVGVGLMLTRDWKTFDRKGMIFPPHNKDCTLFSEKISGKYFALHRPSSPELGGNFIWIAESPDLIHWGQHRCVAVTRKSMWDSSRIGAGAAPIRTNAGWLEIYHGADQHNTYCLGALLLDLENPSKVLARSEEALMKPIASYEREGFLNNVVFTNGHWVEDDTIHLYYGAGDAVIGGADFSIQEILHSLSPN